MGLKILRLIFLLLALLLAGSIIYALGPTKILGNLKFVGWSLGWVFLIGFPRYFIYTCAWKEFLPKKLYSFGRLFQIKVAGELITRSTPAHFLGGDTARVFLMGRRLSRQEQTGSVIMDRTSMSLGALVVVLMGLTAASFRLPLPLLPKLTLWGLAGLLFAGFLFIISHQKRRALGSLVEVLEKIGLRRWIKHPWKEKIAEVDEIVRNYYEQGHARLIRAVALIVIARLTVVFEIFLLLKFLHIPMGIPEALILSSLSLLMTVIFFLFPGNLGVLEGAFGLIFFWLGVDPAKGVSLEILRKLNAGLWYFVGAAIALTFKKETSY